MQSHWTFVSRTTLQRDIVRVGVISQSVLIELLCYDFYAQ